jgi:hypothetical protein
VKGHLSAEEVDGYVMGERNREVEEHLRDCRVCADEVQRVTEPFQLFGSAVRSLGEETAPLRHLFQSPVETSPSQWRFRRITLMAVAFSMMIAVPVYRHEMNRQAAVAATQDEILLRQVESGLSRSVPAPMEPLAKLMSNDVSR